MSIFLFTFIKAIQTGAPAGTMSLRKAIPALALICLAVTLTSAQAGDDLAQRAADSREAIKQAQAALQQELQTAMKKGGPELAIHACSTKALGITREMSQKQHMLIRRTSLKLRNPQDAPDAWEKKVLKDFQGRINRGENPAQMEHFEIVEKDGAKQFRYMKAITIPKNAPCLVCHGDNIDPGLKAKIKGRYPYDEATGFKEGDLRGAFSVRQQL